MYGNDKLRKKKKDKRKKTHDKFGKNTQRGLRIKMTTMENKVEKRRELLRKTLKKQDNKKK